MSCHLKNEVCGFRCTGENFSKQWEELHKLEKKHHNERIAIVKTLDCESCLEDGTDLMVFGHDVVNLGLGKKAFNKNNFHKKYKQIECVRNACLKDGRC